MSRLDDLLVQKEPLERYEIEDLKDWLRVLKNDCATFGETPEDVHRMNAIKHRIKEESKYDLSNS